MANDTRSIKIIGSRTTEDGLLVKFSDGSFYLFHTSFLLENRDKRSDRIQPSSSWLAEHWKRNSSAPGPAGDSRTAPAE